jgi:hypothetical protein
MKLKTLPPTQPDVELTLTYQEWTALMVIAGNTDHNQCYADSSHKSLTTPEAIRTVGEILYHKLYQVHTAKG